MKNLKNNKGYSLIELIIVIAIMAILTGLASYTFGLIIKAKCQNASIEFNQQIGNLWMQTKAVGNVDDNVCMMLKYAKDGDGKWQNELGIYKYDSGTPNDLILLKDENGNEMTTQLTNRVKIEYIGSNPHVSTTSDSTNVVLIQFNKSDGSVLFGEGEYEVYSYNQFTGNKGDLVATIFLDKETGNHYVK